MNGLKKQNSTEIKNTVEDGGNTAQHDVHEHKPQRSFAQRNKYRIRQICGVLALLAVVTGSVVLLTKCGSEISENDTSMTTASQTKTEGSTTSETTTSASDTTSQSESETSGETTTTKETTTTEQDTTEDTTTTTEEQTTAATTKRTTAATTTQQQQTTTPSTTAQTKKTTQATQPVGPSNIETKNGVTYVNGILIANKTYGLPASYVPDLVPIDSYQYLERNTAAAYQKMQAAAYQDGVYLACCSGYRSYATQQYLYNSYAARDGKEAADRYSARPGYSEHQTGLAIDINMASSAFDNTPAAKWLRQHCTEYGFIIRYKANKESKTGYMAESWHVRYLGSPELAKSVEASGLCLEEYLGITSVYANP